MPARPSYRGRFEASLEAAVRAIATAAELRDPYTAGHQHHVAELSSAIAVRLGIDPELVAGIGIAASIHDIGKLIVPAEILSKPGRLTDIEYELVKAHAQAGHDIVAGIDFPWPVAEMILQHHERLDGSGYPRGLRGDEISIGARIIAVADTVEAMSSHRPYRPGLGTEAALAETRRRSRHPLRRRRRRRLHRALPRRVLHVHLTDTDQDRRAGHWQLSARQHRCCQGPHIADRPNSAA